MSTNIEERDSAAEKFSTWTRHPLRCDGTTVETKHFREDKNIAFKAGWDQALTSSVVKGLVDWIRDMPCKCGAFKHLPPPCARCEIIEKYEVAVAQVKGED